jgi:Immunoglobulin-like domain of bacterial spore germination
MSLITPSEPVEAVPEGASPAPPRDRRRRRLYAALVTAIVLIAGLVAVIAWPDGSDDTATTGPSTTVTTGAPTTAPPTTAAPSTTATPTTATPTTPPAVDTATAVFPSGTAPRFHDPVEAARAFALDFVGFSDVVAGPFRAGDARSGEVEIRDKGTGPATTVMLRKLGTDGSWWVIGAATENISVSSPGTGEDIASPVTVSGSALAWEGVVKVEVRQDGTREPLGSGVVTGGGDVMRPFSGSIAFGAPTQSYGALVLVSHSGENGQIVQASVQRVAFDH